MSAIVKSACALSLFAMSVVVGVRAHEPGSAAVFDPPQGLHAWQHGGPSSTLVADSR